MEAGQPGGADVIFTFSSADTWNDATTRGMYMPADRLVATMTDHRRVGRLLVANPYRSWVTRFVRRSLGQEDAVFGVDNPRHGSLRPMRVLRRHPTGIPAIHRLYAAYDRHLRTAAAEMGMEKPAVITCNPFVAGFCPLDWAGPVTFYAFDDWAAYPPHRRWWPAYEAAYARVGPLERRVCAVSHAILDRVAPVGPSAVVPNGLAPEEWQPPWADSGWLQALPPPRILYVGSLDDRIDVAAVVDTARRFPEGSVVLVGPMLDRARFEAVAGLPNVTISAPVGRREVAGLVHQSDVCILPHQRTALTRAMSPLKLYEYLAGGRPVAATDLPPVRAIEGRIVLVEESGSFAEGVGRALELGPASEQERQEFISRNSWASRHEAILDVALRP